MAFRIWFYFLALTALMLVFMWMLQISFIGPYYEMNRSQTTKLKAEEITKIIESDTFLDSESQLIKSLASENMCGAIYNSKGIMVMRVNSKNSSCHLANLSRFTISEYISIIDNSSSQDFSLKFTSEIFEQGLYFYGKEAVHMEEPYYLFLNSPIKLLDSTVFVLKRQFGLLAISVFSIATFIAFVLSKRLSSPISNMTESAERLAQGDFSVTFDSYGYNEIVALSRSLNYATEEFRKTDALRRDLVANVSHDIKTPLTMIKAYAEMIQDISGDDKEKREKHLQVILDETNHLERLVNDMLTLSKYESNVLTVNETDFNLKDHIDNVVQLFQFEDFHIDIDVDKMISVKSDEVKMGQVLYNYISNAKKYAGKEKPIHIKVVDLDDKVMITVRDFGGGIKPETLKNIWDRYYKIDKNFSRKDSTGLGLSIVKAICDACHNEYGVDSIEGEGSSFFYTLRKTL